MLTTIGNIEIGTKLTDSEGNVFVIERFTYDRQSRELNGIDFRGSNTISIHDLRYCILDKEGNEKVVFGRFKSPYLVKNSQIYSIDGNYYNIETGEFYGNPSTNMESSEFLFLDNRFDKDSTKRGIMKVNKKDGIWELFK